jgi:hypothetical protein
MPSSLEQSLARCPLWAPKADKQRMISVSPIRADFVAKVVDGPEER